MASNTETIKARGVLLGRITREGWFRADVELRWRDRPSVTVHHVEVPGYWEFAMSGTLWAMKSSRDCYAGGQIIDELPRIDRPSVPVETLRELHALWSEWHLNGMEAACAHQTRPPGLSVAEALDTVPPCPETGYRYGHAWLVRALPDAVFEQARTLIESLRTVE